MSHNHHSITTTLALALALGAIAPASASARFDLNPGAPTGTTSPQPAVEIVRVSAPGGFDWGDAGIGAAGGLGLTTLAAGGGLVIAGPRRRTRSASDSGHHARPHELAAAARGRDADAQSKSISEQQEAVT